MRHGFVCIIAIAFLATIVSGFATGGRTTARTTSTLLDSTPEGGGGREEASSAVDKKENEPERTLYDVLNASPTDSPQELRRKYTAAARLTHPDSAKSGEPQKYDNVADFREIAAAWGVLSDPKERLRYDRSLKAKELSDNVGSLIDTGFSVAVPFLFETAPNQINKTASDVGKTLLDVGERLDKARKETEKRVGRARAVAGLNRKSSDLAQRATSKAKRAMELKARLGSDRRLGALQDANSELTSNQASRIIDGFDFLKDAGDYTSSAIKTVGTLAQAEGIHKERTSLHQSIKKNLTRTEREMNAARRDGKIAQDRLEEAHRTLGDAIVASGQSEKNREEAIQQERQAATSVDSTEEELGSALRDEQLAKERLEEARRIFEDARAAREQKERTHEEAILLRKETENRAEMAAQKLNSAQRDEQLAQDRLEEARRKVKESQFASEQSDKTHRDTVLLEKESAASLEKALATLKTQQFNARQALRQAEGLNISKENASLKEESEKLEDMAAKLRAKSEELRTKAEELKKEAE